MALNVALVARILRLFGSRRLFVRRDARGRRCRYRCVLDRLTRNFSPSFMLILRRSGRDYFSVDGVAGHGLELGLSARTLITDAGLVMTDRRQRQIFGDQPNLLCFRHAASSAWPASLARSILLTRSRASSCAAQIPNVSTDNLLSESARCDRNGRGDLTAVCPHVSPTGRSTSTPTSDRARLQVGLAARTRRRADHTQRRPELKPLCVRIQPASRSCRQRFEHEAWSCSPYARVLEQRVLNESRVVRPVHLPRPRNEVHRAVSAAHSTPPARVAPKKKIPAEQIHRRCLLTSELFPVTLR